MQLTYGIWLTSYYEPLETFDEDEARRRHDLGEKYFAWWGDPASPNVLMEVDYQDVGVIEVYWLDHLNRWTQNYIFVPEDKTRRADRTQRLFLEQVRHKTWTPEFDEEDDDNSLTAMVTYFKHDGSGRHMRDMGEGLEEAETPALPPAEAEKLLFEPWPAFGDWASITRSDRDS